jgi:hypothetical protein
MIGRARPTISKLSAEVTGWNFGPASVCYLPMFVKHLWVVQRHRLMMGRCFNPRGVARPTNPDVCRLSADAQGVWAYSMDEKWWIKAQAKCVYIYIYTSRHVSSVCGWPAHSPSEPGRLHRQSAEGVTTSLLIGRLSIDYLFTIYLLSLH